MFKTLTAVALIATPAAALLAQAMPASTYVAKAGAGDLYERSSSQLLLRSGNPEIRRFATMMVRDHNKSTADVKAAARASRVRVGTPVLSPKQARMVAQLRAARGADRDRLYVEQQRMAHQEALELHRGYARDGAARPLRMTASKIAPVVQHHIDMLARM